MIQNFNNCDNVHGWIPLSRAGTYICSSCSERKQLLHFRFWRKQLFVEVVASSSEEALVRYVLVYVIQNCYMPTCVFCATMLWCQYWFQAHFCVGTNWILYYYHPTSRCQLVVTAFFWWDGNLITFVVTVLEHDSIYSAMVKATGNTEKQE